MGKLPRRLVCGLVCSVLAIAMPVPSVFAAAPQLKGVVTLNGAPLTEGKITFSLDDGQFVGSHLKKDGSYHIDFVPSGKLKVTIMGPGVPPKYSSPQVSQLVVMISDSGANYVFDFDLRKPER